MQVLLPCTCPSLPPSLRTRKARNHLQINAIVNHKTEKLKTTLAPKFHAGAKSSLLLCNLYLQLYANDGDMQRARTLFNEMPERTLISWTTLMSGYAKHGPAWETLLLFKEMLWECRGGSLWPDSYVYAVVLRACVAVEGSLGFGRVVHGQLLKRGGVIDGFVENALVNMYASCGALSDAIVVFDGIEMPDLVAWSSMLSGYVKNGLEDEGLGVFLDMVSNGVQLDAFAFSMAIKACANLECLGFGLQIHCYMVKMGFGSSLFLENTLMYFYAKCGDLEGLSQIFGGMSKKDLVSWNTLIMAYVHNSHCLEALSAFCVLISETSVCDDFTITSILKAVTNLDDLEFGKQVHGYIIRAGLESSHYVTSSLLDMYVECIDHESLDSRERIPLKLLTHIDGKEYDGCILSSMLKWCALQYDLETGKVFHSMIIKLNMTADSFVFSSLIDMYSKCGFLEVAQTVFLEVKDAGTAPWSALISGYSWNGWFTEALKLFRKMQFSCVEANEFTFTSVILACLAVRDIRKGRELHCKMLRAGYGSNVPVVNTLIILYSELCHWRHALNLCSFISDTEISWNVLIHACLKAKNFEMVHELFRRIQLSCAYIDPNTACGILSSCGSPVLLSLGTQTQAYMIKRGIISHPTTANCLIRMYSGCGRITDANLAFKSMSMKNPLSWTSIISAKVDHGYPYEALDIFTKLRWRGKSVDPCAFSSAMKACAKLGLVDEANHLFRLMEEVYGIEPSEEHYSCMIEILGRAGMFKEIREIIKGIPLNLGSSIWRALISSCRLNGNMEVAKYAVKKLLEVEPSDLSAHALLRQIHISLGEWDEAAKLKPKNISMVASSSWIEVKNKIYEFASNKNPTKEVCVKLAEIKETMEELGYVADRNHLLHDAEEEEYEAVGMYHTELRAVAFGLVSLPQGTPIQVTKSVRMCGDCHSACKFMSTFINRELVVKDPCNFHHFIDGKCSCRDTW